MVSKIKESIIYVRMRYYLCEDEIVKSVTHDHHLLSLCQTVISRTVFLSNPHTYDIFLLTDITLPIHPII